MAATPPDYLSFLDNLFGPAGHMAYLDGLTAGALPGAAAGSEGAAPPAQEVSFADTLSDYEGPVKYHDGAEYDAKTLRHLTSQIAQNFDAGGSQGGAYSTKGGSIGFDYGEASKVFKSAPTADQQVMLDMAAHLATNGVTDLSQLTTADQQYTALARTGMGGEGGDEVATEATRKVLARRGDDGAVTNLTKFGNQTREYIDPAAFGATYAGRGGTVYGMEFGPDGRPVFRTGAKETSDRGAIMAALSFAAMPFMGPLANMVQGAAPGLGAVGSKALTQGLANGLLSKAGGGSFGRGFAGGAVGGAVSALNPAGYFGITDKVAGSAVNGAISGGLRAGVTGGDVGRGILGGGVSGAVAGFNPAARMGVTDKTLASIINGGAAGLTSSAVTGGDPRAGALNGIVNGALRIR